jgi:hypothetical protein
LFLLLPHVHYVRQNKKQHQVKNNSAKAEELKSLDCIGAFFLIYV